MAVRAWAPASLATDLSLIAFAVTILSCPINCPVIRLFRLCRQGSGAVLLCCNEVLCRYEVFIRMCASPGLTCSWSYWRCLE